jgi:hypothetical protein
MLRLVAVQAAPEIAHDELMALVRTRPNEVRAFLDWADQVEARWSMRLRNRSDIPQAAEAADLFPEAWWGHVVFSCFGSGIGTRAAAPHFQEPLPPELAEEVLAQIAFPRRSVGHHRIQSTLTGAKRALVGACGNPDLFERVLHSDAGFDERYEALWQERPRYWGRTTIFDLLLRAGALAVGGREVLPDRAYLAGSTGPAAGFKKIFGIAVSPDNAEWAEAVLRAWTRHWDEVTTVAGADWTGFPYQPGDFENALCIWQEEKSAGLPLASTDDASESSASSTRPGCAAETAAEPKPARDPSRRC